MRQENKYLITQMDALFMSSKLAQIMQGDKHNATQGYMIRSMYFDTLNNEDFSDKQDGLELRRKIRLRVYDPHADFAMLEMKQKQGNLQKKRSLRMSREDAQRLTQGEYQVLLRYPDAFAAELFGLMQRKTYRPKTIVEYDRLAFIAKENSTRITFDQRIRANEAMWDVFAHPLPLYPVMDPFNVVLEVKFNGFLLSYIKNTLNLVDRSAISISKYCLGRLQSVV